MEKNSMDEDGNSRVDRLRAWAERRTKIISITSKSVRRDQTINSRSVYRLWCKQSKTDTRGWKILACFACSSTSRLWISSSSANFLATASVLSRSSGYSANDWGSMRLVKRGKNLKTECTVYSCCMHRTAMQEKRRSHHNKLELALWKTYVTDASFATPTPSTSPNNIRSPRCSQASVLHSLNNITQSGNKSNALARWNHYKIKCCSYCGGSSPAPPIPAPLSAMIGDYAHQALDVNMMEHERWGHDVW